MIVFLIIIFTKNRGAFRYTSGCKWLVIRLETHCYGFPPLHELSLPAGLELRPGSRNATKKCSLATSTSFTVVFAPGSPTSSTLKVINSRFGFWLTTKLAWKSRLLFASWWFWFCVWPKHTATSHSWETLAPNPVEVKIQFYKAVEEEVRNS